MANNSSDLSGFVYIPEPELTDELVLDIRARPDPGWSEFTTLGDIGDFLFATAGGPFAPGFNVQLFGATGNGTTDDAAAINGVIVAAAGRGPVIFPGVLGATTTPAVYLIRSPIIVPSDTHLIIEAGATIRIANGTNSGCMQIVANASSILIELYGTLDGNASNQTPTQVIPSAGITGQGNVPFSNALIWGGRSGVITNFKTWPVAFAMVTNVEVNGITMSNCGGAPGINGISTRHDVTSGTYNPGTGVMTLTSADTHNINVGDTFTYVAAPTPQAFLQGEFIATSVTPTTVTCTAPTGQPGGPSWSGAAGTQGRIGTCIKSFNSGFVNCTVRNIRDTGLTLYGGVVNGYFRDCDADAGPFIYSDVGQPGSNVACEISGCYIHDASFGGPTVTSLQFGIYQKDSRVHNNVVLNMLRGGINIGSCDGVEVYGNTLSNNVPTFISTSQQNGQISAGGSSRRVNVWGNTIHDPGPAATAQQIIVVTAMAYDNATGVTTLTLASPPTLPINIGDDFIVFNVLGFVAPDGTSTSYLALNGEWIALAGTAGSTVVYQAPVGLGTITLLGTSAGVIATTLAVDSAIAPGTYSSDGSGNLSLITSTPHLMVSGDVFVITSIFGTGVPGYMNSQFTATAGTAGTTLNFIIPPSVTMTITSGKVLPANFGISIDTPDYCRISDNRIGDYQKPTVMTTCIGGTWGLFGSSYGNYFGPRAAVSPDTSFYVSGSVNGLNYDLVSSIILGNAAIAGSVTFLGNTQQSGSTALSGYFQSKGLTPGWNNDMMAEVDFFCGRDSGTPGGFDFLQVASITVSTGTYNSGTGAVVMTTGVPHGMLPGGVFTVSNVTNSSHDVAMLDGAQVATGGTSGSTLNYTGATGLSLQGAITGGIVTPHSGAPIGVASGTYNSGTGAVSLTTVTPHGIAVSGAFSVDSLMDGNPAVTSLNGTHTATGGTTGSTLDFTDSTGLSITFPITGATIVPNGTSGGVVDTTRGVSGSLLANDGYGNTRIGGALVQGAMQTAALSNAGTVTVIDNTGFVAIQNASSIATASVVLPAQLAFQYCSGMELELNFENPIGALTVTAAFGASVVNPPTSVTVAGVSFNFIKVGTVWTRRIAM